MAKKKDSCRQMLAAAVLVAFAYGCGGEESVDHGGSLVSEEGQIAFSRFTRFTPPNFESEVYTINVDGSGEKRLTDSPGLDAFPAWSPDGEKIAFASEKDGETYTMNVDGSGRTRLTEYTGLRSLAADVVPRRYPHRLHLRGPRWDRRDLRHELGRIGPHQADRQPGGRLLPRLAALSRFPR